MSSSMIMSWLSTVMIAYVASASPEMVGLSILPHGARATNVHQFSVKLSFSSVLRSLTGDELQLTAFVLQGSALTTGVVLSATPPVQDTADPATYTIDVELLPRRGTSATFPPGQVIDVVFSIDSGNVIRSVSGEFNQRAMRDSVRFDTKPPVAAVTIGEGPGPSSSPFSSSSRRTLLVDFGEAVTGFAASAVQLIPLPHTPDFEVSVDSVRINKAVNKAGDDEEQDYYLVDLTFVGEGVVDVIIDGSNVVDSANNPPVNTTVSLTLVRDISAPKINLAIMDGGDPLNGTGTYHVKTNGFLVTVTFSEPIVTFPMEAIFFTTLGRGAALYTTPLCISCEGGLALKSSGSGAVPGAQGGGDSDWYLDLLDTDYIEIPDTRVWQVNVTSLVSFNDASSASHEIEVTLTVNEDMIHDHAFNSKHSSSSITVSAELSAFVARVSSTEALPPSVTVFGTSLDIFLIVAAVILVASVVFLACLWRFKRARDRRQAKALFEQHAAKVFEEYGDSSRYGGVVFDQIVGHGVSHGYGRRRSEDGARRLMAAADTNKDGVLSLEEFTMWLATVIAKGEVITYEHLRELRTQFRIQPDNRCIEERDSLQQPLKHASI